MRSIAVMRERYGFTAAESLDMPYADFDRWLGALLDEKDDGQQSGDVWEAVNE